MIKLNLGSGGRWLPGYVNIDTIDFDLLEDPPSDKVEYLKCNVFELRKHFLSDSVDEVYASHFFEHLEHADIIELLYIVWDIFREGGELRVVVPDFYTIMANYSEKHAAGNFSDLDLLHTKVFNCEEETFHKSIWSEQIGKHYLTREGFFAIEAVVCREEEIVFQCKVIKK